MSAGTQFCMDRRRFLRATGVAGLTGLAGCLASEDGGVTRRSSAPGWGIMYKDPSCTCCDRYATYLAERGRRVDVRPVDDMAAVKVEYRVPSDLFSCHTIVTDGSGYVVEGHVPGGAIDRLLDDRPDVVGVALPGMPGGSPGMGGEKSAPFTVYAFRPDGSYAPFARV